jgi:hypothetical protein
LRLWRWQMIPSEFFLVRPLFSSRQSHSGQ